MEPGEKIPSERQLCAIYNISRTTVRNAITDLEYQGIVKRIQGKGTFVGQPRSQKQNLSHYYSFTEETKKRGMVPHSEILEYHIFQADPAIQAILGLSEGEDVIEFLRLRKANEDPMMLERSFIPYADFPEISRKLLEDHPLYGIFEEVYQRKIHRVQERFSVGMLDKKQASLLEEKPHQPCLNIERKSYDASGKLIEYTTSVASGSKFFYETSYQPQ